MQSSKAREEIDCVILDLLEDEMSEGEPTLNLAVTIRMRLLSRPDLIRDALGMTERTERQCDNYGHEHDGKSCRPGRRSVWVGEWRKTDG